jgi:hypothetical protein
MFKKVSSTQAKKYGPVPAGKHWKHGSNIPTGKSPNFFRGLPTSFPFFPAGNARKSLEKIRKYSGWNTASMFYHFSPLSGRFQWNFGYFRRPNHRPGYRKE